MKFLILFGIFAVIFPSFTNGEKSCKEFISETMEKTMKSFFACKKEMTFASEEDKISKMHCILVCAMKKEKFLTPDGYVDEASLLHYVEREIPSAVQDRAMNLMLKCQEHTANLDPEEDKCLTYSALLKCAITVVFKVCN